jgi:hypothetical protein
MTRRLVLEDRRRVAFQVSDDRYGLNVVDLSAACPFRREGLMNPYKKITK